MSAACCSAHTCPALPAPVPSCQSLVLDLRDNRGGLVSEGLEVARLFLEGGCVEALEGWGPAPAAYASPCTQGQLIGLARHTAIGVAVLYTHHTQHSTAALCGSPSAWN
jgi:hypothetical protein